MNENEMDGLTGYEWFRGELPGHPSTCVYLDKHWHCTRVTHTHSRGRSTRCYRLAADTTTDGQTEEPPSKRASHPPGRLRRPSTPPRPPRATPPRHKHKGCLTKRDLRLTLLTLLTLLMPYILHRAIHLFPSWLAGINRILPRPGSQLVQRPLIKLKKPLPFVKAFIKILNPNQVFRYTYLIESSMLEEIFLRIEKDIDWERKWIINKDK